MSFAIVKRLNRAPSGRKCAGASRMFALAGVALLCVAAAPSFRVHLDAGVSPGPYTGRVWVVLSQEQRREPLDTVGWTTRSLIYAHDVTDWKAEQPLNILPETARLYGEAVLSVPKGAWRAQAAIDLVPWSHRVLRGPGNPISDAVAFQFDPDAPQTVELRLSRTNPAWNLEDSEDCKYVRLPSRLLSQFHKRDVEHRARVALPAGYATATARQYSTVYVVGGFSSDVRSTAAISLRDSLAALDAQAVVVFIDADCPTGHHVFADSANNGPAGTALVEELIPQLEKKFRLRPDAAHRFVTGHSSGGWSSLWLQITYPETFGGCWSLAPDPVDFHAFQTADIYNAGENLYVQPDGEPRPLSRGGMGRVLITRPFCELEDMLGRGGQLQSFEAVFGPRSADGRPVALWDRQSGRIDARVAEAWREYDIQAILSKNWIALEPKLKGKLHLVCGDQDTFFLERAFFRLRDELQRLGSDAEIEVIPGAGHGLSHAAWSKVHEQIAGAIRKSEASEQPSPSSASAAGAAPLGKNNAGD